MTMTTSTTATAQRHSGEPGLAALRARLASQDGPRYWRSLEELAETPEFLAYLDREFPERADQWSDGESRRAFLKLMGASLALAGVACAGCSSEPAEKIVPYVRMPEQLVPGKPLYYATLVPLGGHATGVLAESHMGRPTMVEGNPAHPDSLGAIDPWTQATVLTLYDPDRSQVVLRRRLISTWDAFLLEAEQAIDAVRGRKGAGLRILTETVTSPTLARQLRELRSDLPEAKWHQYEPAGGDQTRAGARLAFGTDVSIRYHLHNADVIVALDADFLTTGPGRLCYARQFAQGREPQAENMNRLYAVEPSPTITGAMADHRLAVASHRVEGIARALAEKLEVKLAPTSAALEPALERWVDAVARDLRSHKGASLVVAGETQPPSVHALTHALNEVLENVGKTLAYLEPVEAEPVDQVESLRTLVDDMEAGQVSLLLILGGNPVYTAPADLDFTRALKKVGLSAHLSLYDDETSAACHWQLPEAHCLEAWSDARAFDGTVSIQQPLIAPLYGGKSAHELLAILLTSDATLGYEIVRATWKGASPPSDFETFWRTSVHDGVMAGSAAKLKDVAVKREKLLSPSAATPAAQAGGLELNFRLDPTIHDGRFANNGWLQELPKPLTKLTWDNVALLSPRTAEAMGLASGHVAEFHFHGRTVRAPVWINPGQADDTVTVHLGYGRTRAGRVGNGAGFNAYTLRTSGTLWSGTGVTMHATGATQLLASTQLHRPMNWVKDETTAAAERALVKENTLAGFLAHPDFAREKPHGYEHEPKPADSLHDNYRYDGYAWGMVINLNACTGCNACVTACQAENNIPVVGRDQVAMSREMHWIDVDRYYHGDLDAPEVRHQPRTCMHCENAPCEVVCPVGATLHDAEGINNMVYNRCVGTRYCGNNCPYKVRHFNFLLYADRTTPSLALLNNPDVTVRARGVMEKCTYCIQRINEARYTAEIEGRKIRDGEVVTACQAACPTRAIVFGNLSDKQSQVAKLKGDPRHYGLLEELNTRPRTTYLARLSNPNPELQAESRDGI
jgi:molybdopterin-containing oxidoreductase family iron-sulfur binding subunit